ncbi:MAG TPA: Gfo/Idh/MocA family oxidoreductase, partial [Gaiellales bacterium]
LRVGVIGAGMIAQVEHIPNLVHLRDRFELVGIADPSAHVRAAMSERYGVAGFESADALLREPLDAVIVAVPDPMHASTVLAALAAGLHVFCEKPLCFTDAEGAAIAAARDRAGRVVQVGYMKRYDPNYEAALGFLPDGAEGLRYISVEVSDPDSWPFMAHRPLVRANDVPAALIDDTRTRQRAQAAEALGVVVDGADLRGYCDPLMSGVVHCVNSVHGMLDHMGVEAGPVVGGHIFANGEGAAGSVALLGGRALWHLVQVLVPDVGWYRERYVLHFSDRVVELEFPSPYLNNQQTALRVRRSEGLRLETLHVEAGYEEAFVRELEAFHASAVTGVPVRNTVEEAMRDAHLLTGIARLAIGATA